MNFFDTSVFVAAFLKSHASHNVCARRIADLDRKNACCGAHTLGEMYSSLTRLARPYRLAPLEAATFSRAIVNRVACVSLSTDEYMDVIEEAAQRGLSGPIIYDALLLACARKSGAKRIYTLNVRHFKLVAPDLASRIHEP